MTPGARFFCTRRRLLTNTRRVASVGLWLALFGGLLYLAPIVPKGLLSVTLPNKDTVNPNLWAFSPDGKLLVTADDGLTREWQAPGSLPLGPVDVWDVETRQKRFTLAENAFYLDDVVFSPDSKLLFVGRLDQNYELEIRDCMSGRLRAKLTKEANDQLSLISRFSPDGRYLVIAQYRSFQDPPERFDLREIESEQLCPIEGTIENVVFSRDGTEMIIVHEQTGKGQFPTVRWVGPNAIPGVWTQSAKAHAKAGGIAPDLETSVFVEEASDGGRPPELVIGNLATGREKQRRAIPPKAERYAGDPPSFSPAGKFVVVCMWQPSDADGGWGGDREGYNIFVFGVDRFLARPDTFAATPLFSWNDQWLLARHHDEPGATLFDTGTMTRHGELCVPGDTALKVNGVNLHGPDWFYKDAGKSLFAPDNKTVVLRGLVRTRQPNPVLVWLNNQFGATTPAQTVECARLWDVETCTELGCFDDCIQALYSPDGKMLATAHTDGKVRLWDVPPRKPVLAVLGMSLVLWLSVLVAIRLWVRGTGGWAKLLGHLFRYYRRVPR